MTINSTLRTVGPIIGNGTFAAFPFAFKVFNTTELSLVATDSGVDRNLVLNTDYRVTLNTDQNASPGGTITYRVAGVDTNIPTNTTINGTSNVANLQPINLTNNGGFFPAVINAGLDRLTILVQQLVRGLSAAIQYPLSDGTGISNLLPAKALRLGKIFAWDSVTGAPAVSNLTLAQIEAIATAGTNANVFYAGATTGTGDAVVANTGLPGAGYIAGQVFHILMSAANTVTNPTINMGGGVKNIKQIISGGKSNLTAANSYFNGYLARFIYDGTDMILTNPWLIVGGMASINTGTDLTGTDSINTYAQVDAYQPQSAMGAVGASSVPGISASTSRGTGIVPIINNTLDLIGGLTTYIYTGAVAAYTAATAIVGRAVGATANNLGGQIEFWTKADNGALTLAMTIKNNQVADFVNSPTVGGVGLLSMAANSMRANPTAATANGTDLAIGANQFPGRSSTGNLAAKPMTDFGFSIVNAADAAAFLALLAGAPMTSYTPVVTSQGGTITAYTASGAYMQIGKMCYVITRYVITTLGSATGYARVTLPLTSAATPASGGTPGMGPGAVSGREDAATGAMMQGVIRPSQAYMDVFTYNNGAGVAASFDVMLAGWYRVA